MPVSISGDPPYSWYKGTDLEEDFLWSRVFCEPMQALKNRADLVSVIIADWHAYDADGVSLQNLGQTPNDADLDTNAAWRHVNVIMDLRTALEAVLGSYYLPYPDWDTPYTLTSLMTAAEGRATYNRSEAQLLALGYFDGKDVEEILKCVDLLLFTGHGIVIEESGIGVPTLCRHHQPGTFPVDMWARVEIESTHYTFTFASSGTNISYFEGICLAFDDYAVIALKNGVPTTTHTIKFTISAGTPEDNNVWNILNLIINNPTSPDNYQLNLNDYGASEDYFKWWKTHDWQIQTNLGFSNLTFFVDVILKFTAA